MLLNKRIPVRYIFKKVRLELCYVSIIGLLVYFITHNLQTVLPVMPISIPTFIGTAISVILSFKLNQSYDRWWEARKIWGNIVNESRYFVLQLQSFLRVVDGDTIKKISRRQMGWCYSLGQTLRGLDPLENLPAYLSEQEMDFVKTHHNKPLAILQLNSKHLAALRADNKLDSFEHITILNTISNFTTMMGMAERIKTTIFPVTYKYFLHLIIYLFVITLSIALRDIESYYEIPLLLLISSAFFLLEKTATHLQDPFSNLPTDTPMTAIAKTIELNICQLINDPKTPELANQNNFYLM